VGVRYSTLSHSAWAGPKTNIYKLQTVLPVRAFDQHVKAYFHDTVVDANTSLPALRL
jgi:hypothetical protein